MNRFTFSFGKAEQPKFIFGKTVITQGAKSLLSDEEIVCALRRHMLGDWGDLEDEDKAANESALKSGDRLVSRYLSASGNPYYIITEADRSYTTLLLPEEY